MDNNKELIKSEIKKLLVAFHKGVPLPSTLQNILDIMDGAEYINERKFLYLLEGLYQDKIEAFPTKEEDRHYLAGYADAVDENNFAVKLAIEVIMGAHDDNSK